MSENIISFSDMSNEIKGIVTPEMLRKHMDEWVDDYGEIKYMVVLYVYEDEGKKDSEHLRVGYSSIPDLKLMGLLEWAKQTICRDQEERNV